MGEMNDYIVTKHVAEVSVDNYLLGGGGAVKLL